MLAQHGNPLLSSGVEHRAQAALLASGTSWPCSCASSGHDFRISVSQFTSPKKILQEEPAIADATQRLKNLGLSTINIFTVQQPPIFRTFLPARTLLLNELFSNPHRWGLVSGKGWCQRGVPRRRLS